MRLHGLQLLVFLLYKLIFTTSFRLERSVVTQEEVNTCSTDGERGSLEVWNYYPESERDSDPFYILTCSNVNFENGFVPYYRDGWSCSYCSILKITSSVIPTIPSSAFIKFSEYSRLYLTGLQIRNILPDAFKSLKSVEEINMSNNYLTHIPDGIFDSLERLKILDLSKNSIKNLSVHAFVGVNLYLLNLSANALKSLSEGFINVTYIKVLDLSVNNFFNFNFTEVSEKVEFLNVSNNYINQLTGCFSKFMKLDLSRNNLTSLEHITCNHSLSSKIIYLDISNNVLSGLYPKLFSTLNQIQRLVLRNNSITSIPSGCFSQSSLKELDLSSNHITYISDKAFNSSVKLKELDLSRNSIKNISNRALSGMDVHILNLTFNTLEFLGSNFLADVGHVGVLDLSSNNFSKFNFSHVSNKVQNLNISNNRIKEISGNLGKFFKVDLSRNEIHSLNTTNSDSGPSNILELDVSYNKLSNLRSEWFSTFDKIRYLSLHNNIINFIPGGCFSLTTLNTLDLSNNNITNISEQAFNLVENLDILDLSRNNIKHIGGRLVAGMNIHTLNLSFNAIDFTGILENDSFEHIKHIVILDLSSNHLTKFYFAEVNAKVYSLDLSNNNIMEITGCFTKFTELYLRRNDISSLKAIRCDDSEPHHILKFDISYNLLSELEPKVFSSSDTLKELYLQHNNIKEISGECFSTLRSLKILNLSFNYLKNFQYGLFDKLSDLTLLDISSNKLKSLTRSTYHLLTNLQDLYVQKNELNTLNSEDILLRLTNLRYIHLDWNPFTCDDLIEIFHHLKDMVVPGNTFNISNVHGIACNDTGANLNFTKPQDSVGVYVDEYLRSRLKELLGNNFNNSLMYNYFNKDFENSNFHKYLESLNNRPKGESDAMNNYFNDDFKKSKFYGYLESLEKLQFSSNYSDRAGGQPYNSMDEQGNANLALLIVIMLLLILISSFLLFIVLVMRGKTSSITNCVSMRGDRIELLNT